MLCHLQCFTQVYFMHYLSRKMTSYIGTLSSSALSDTNTSQKVCKQHSSASKTVCSECMQVGHLSLGIKYQTNKRLGGECRVTYCLWIQWFCEQNTSSNVVVKGYPLSLFHPLQFTNDVYCTSHLPHCNLSSSQCNQTWVAPCAQNGSMFV